MVEAIDRWRGDLAHTNHSPARTLHAKVRRADTVRGSSELGERST
jgi:hypothetical protein